MATRNMIENERKSRQLRYFCESFKREKVEELDKNLTSVAEISREFEVTRTAIYKWIYKYSAMKKKALRQVIEPLSDSQKIKELRDQVKELERIVGQKQIMIDFMNKMIDLAEDEYKLDIKKKFGGKPSSGSGSTGNSSPVK